MKITVPIIALITLGAGASSSLAQAYRLRALDPFSLSESLLEDFWRVPKIEFPAVSPPTSRLRVVENENLYGVQLDLPGFQPSELDVSLDKDRVLMVRGKHECTDEKDLHCLKRSVYESVHFGRDANLDWDQVDVSYDQGVLSVTAKKAPVKEEATRKLPIRSSPILQVQQ